MGSTCIIYIRFVLLLRVSERPLKGFETFVRVVKKLGKDFSLGILKVLLVKR